MDIVTRSTDSVKRLWGSLNGPQRLVLALSFVLMIGLLLWGSGSAAGDPWQKVAGHEVSDAERAEILKSLAKKQVPYEVRGGEIHVRRSQADKVVLELAGEGNLTDKAVWAWLDSTDVFATSGDKDRRFQLSLQRKLEFMIRKIEAVGNASVVITQASESQQIGFQGPKASASVLLELKSGQSLARGNIQAIARLVAGAVKGLDPDRVYISDAQGTAYAIPRAGTGPSLAADIRDIEARLENELREKIMLLFPTMRVVVRCVANNREERLKEEIHPKGTPHREEERRVIEESGSDAGVPSIKGGGDVGPAPVRVKKTSVESRTETTLDKRVREQYDPAGKIEKVSVSVLLPVMKDRDGKDLEAPPKMEDIRVAVMNATGAAQDAVTVLFVPTRAPEPIAAVPPAERTLEWFFENWTKIALGLLALFALVVVAWAIRGGMPKGEVEEIKAIAARLGEPLQTAAADPLRPAEGDVAALRRGIQEAVDRDPEEAASALKSWVAGR
jgi:flagellar M-ring protein FliF